MSPETFIQSARRCGIEFSLENGSLRVDALPATLTERRKSLIREHKEAIEDYLLFAPDIAVYRVLRGEANEETILPLLDASETDDNLRVWIERALKGWRYDDSGSPVAPPNDRFQGRIHAETGHF